MKRRILPPLPPIVLAAAVALCCLAGVHAARAHGDAGPPAPGIAIASLTHGQMVVVARYRGEILDLAYGQVETDPDFRRLLNHGNIQYTYCLWGLMPGSLTDEQSPFNECSHAYLAAAKALLAYMETMPKAHEAAAALVSRIDADMVRGGASWVLCGYSSEAFSTGAFVAPDWKGLLRHAPSLMAMAFLAMLALTALRLLLRPAADRHGRAN